MANFDRGYEMPFARNQGSRFTLLGGRIVTRLERLYLLSGSTAEERERRWACRDLPKKGAEKGRAAWVDDNPHKLL